MPTRHLPLLATVSRLPRCWLTLIPGILSAGALGAAFMMQYVGGLPPCEMCIWQRWPYGVALLLSAGAYMFASYSRTVTLYLLVACILSLVTVSGLAGYHVAVEQGWVEPEGGCAGSSAHHDTLEDLKAAILNAPIVRCDEPSFTLFGLSIAALNFFASLCFAYVCALATWIFYRQRVS